jgi:hypothetical protein
MVALSEFNAKQAKMSDRAKFMKTDLFEFDFSKANVLTMFLLPSINMKLRPKILDMRPGTRIVSNSFTMENWQPDDTQTLGGDCTSWCTAHLWIVPAKVDGTWQLGQNALALKQEFQVVSGTLGSNAISNGKLNGENITFSAGNVTYTGKVDGSTMRGTMSSGGNWTATKK